MGMTLGPASDRIFGWMALGGFLLAAAAHGASVLGFDVQEHIPFVFGLHVGIFVVWFPAVLRARTLRVDLEACLPPWVRTVLFVLFAYALLNFVFSLSQLGGGQPGMRDGRYVLLNKSKLVREINAQEYHQLRAFLLRAFSGHWLLFYGAACGFLLWRRPVPVASLEQPGAANPPG